ncbi:MAG: hypothetical protein QNJ97_11445 [Myxococcota bacterium]|nr:hypothetical protein [Myxococcota bacterium]
MRTGLWGVALWLIVLSGMSSATAQQEQTSNTLIFGIKVRAGGRYDNVRMCVATPPGAKGGPAMDISVFTEIGLKENISLEINLPVVRPILFGIAFQMLQLEPQVTLLFRGQSNEKIDIVAGPSLGISLHYGPDYNSDRSGDARGPSFFALGPMVGGYLGLDFKRPDETFNFQLGIHPYAAPLFGVNDPQDHKGIVIGGMLDGLFRFDIDQ